MTSQSQEFRSFLEVPVPVPEKNWSQKKVLVPVPEKLVLEKVPVPVPEKLVPEKSTGPGTGRNSWYRHTLQGNREDKKTMGVFFNRGYSRRVGYPVTVLFALLEVSSLQRTTGTLI